ncbi:MAG: hypothetical protein V1839_00535 [archaeon]
MVSKLEDAQNKLRFADYLLQRGSPEFITGAMKHILQAANLAVSAHLALDEKTIISPALARQKLSEGSVQEQEFSVYFLQLWKLTTSPNLTTSDVANAYKRVKTFIDYVKSVRSTI